MKNLILLITLLMSVSALATDKVVVFIPGAGSSGPKMGSRLIGALMGSINKDEYFRHWQKSLDTYEIPNFVCPKTEDGDIRGLFERAEECITQILETTQCQQGRNVVLFGHSMGGIIARIVASDPRTRNCIDSVTSLSTPHRGTEIADFTIDQFKKEQIKIPLTEAEKSLRWVIKLIDFSPEKKRYIKQLQRRRDGKNPHLFRAQDIPDNHDVEYYSFTTSFEKTALAPLILTRKIIANEIRKSDPRMDPSNDGIVPLYSQAYGKFIAHFETTHWEAVCPDPLTWTSGCKKATPQIIDHLFWIAGE
jgi:pimeloyl-ACP methyl ester carboxylesterase